MALCRWDTAPQPVQAQVKRFISDVRSIMDDNLVGGYLHGSLAMGCFNPEASDIDLLFVVQRALSPEQRRMLAGLLMTISGSPRPLEVHVVRQSNLLTWRYPFPYEFHYSEGWRERYEANLLRLDWEIWTDTDLTDIDLAAHFTILRKRGIALFGPAIEDLFPAVPPADYRSAILDDYQAARRDIAAAPVYGILNLLRVWYHLAEGVIASKEEGGLWGLRVITEPEPRQLIELALVLYRGDVADGEFSPGALERFTRMVDGTITHLLTMGHPTGAPDGEPAQHFPLLCLRCQQPLRFAGTGRFEADASGSDRTPLVLYVCPACNKAEFFVQTSGETGQ